MAKLPNPEIIKVQVPIVGSKDNLLAYDRRRQHVSVQEMTAPVNKKMGGDVKAFFIGQWDGHKWVVGARTDWQDW